MKQQTQTAIMAPHIATLNYNAKYFERHIQHGLYKHVLDVAGKLPFGKMIAVTECNQSGVRQAIYHRYPQEFGTIIHHGILYITRRQPAK